MSVSRYALSLVDEKCSVQNLKQTGGETSLQFVCDMNGKFFEGYAIIRMQRDGQFFEVKLVTAMNFDEGVAQALDLDTVRFVSGDGFSLQRQHQARARRLGDCPPSVGTASQTPTVTPETAPAAQSHQ